MSKKVNIPKGYSITITPTNGKLKTKSKKKSGTTKKVKIAGIMVERDTLIFLSIIAAIIIFAKLDLIKDFIAHNSNNYSNNDLPKQWLDTYFYNGFCNFSIGVQIIIGLIVSFVFINLWNNTIGKLFLKIQKKKLKWVYIITVAAIIINEYIYSFAASGVHYGY